MSWSNATAGQISASHVRNRGRGSARRWRGGAGNHRCHERRHRASRPRRRGRLGPGSCRPGEPAPCDYRSERGGPSADVQRGWPRRHHVLGRALQLSAAAGAAPGVRTLLSVQHGHRGRDPRVRRVRDRLPGAIQRTLCLRHLGRQARTALAGAGSIWNASALLPLRPDATHLRL